MAKGTSVLFLLAVAVVGQALTPTTYITQADRDRLKGIFGGAQPYGSDLETTYYSILGFTLLEEAVKDAQKACVNVKANVDASDVDSLFFATEIAQNLKSSKVTCQIPSGSAEKVLTEAIGADGASTITIYHAVAALSNLGLKVDSAKVSTALNDALRSDEGLLSHGYAFYAASYLSGDLKKFYELIEDIIAQADEVNDKYLQFEGGLYTTATIVDGAYKLATKAKTAPAFTDVDFKIVQFANYFLSRKHVHSLKNAAMVLSVLKTLTINGFHVPIAVTLSSEVSVSDKNPTVQVRVTDLMGGSLGKVAVTADTARHLGDHAVVLSKKPFTASAKDDSLYEMEFLSIKPARGFYRILLSIVPQKADGRLIGTSGAEVEVKVTTSVVVQKVELGIADKEQSSATKTTKLQHPNKAATVLEADHHQRVMMSFQLKDKSTDTAMTAHQAFVRLTNLKTKQEIFFVPESDASSTYKFDLDVGDKAKDFGYLSGKYGMDLIIGDAVIQNPFFWTVADVSLSFQEAPYDDEESTQSRYSKKPEIKHLFREPEARPPAAVSMLFTGLVLLPVLILIIMWLKLGANISGYPMNLSAIGFHLGLTGIFVLYYFYWWKLNMFDTLRYLGFIGLATFLMGNRLLSSIAAKKKKVPTATLR